MHSGWTARARVGLTTVLPSFWFSPPRGESADGGEKERGHDSHVRLRRGQQPGQGHGERGDDGVRGGLFRDRGAERGNDKYYYLGSQRTAIRTTTAVYYLVTDHLGSTSLTTDANGARYAELRFKPYGEVRYSYQTMPTDRRYTGQHWVEGIGLYDYRARWYDPALARFVSADTIVPDPTNPQSFNRYMYTQGNPVRYCDPGGHCITPFCVGEAILLVALLTIPSSERIAPVRGAGDDLRVSRPVDIVSVKGPDSQADGSYNWQVQFKVGSSQPGWMIQKIEYVNEFYKPDGTSYVDQGRFYEAWPVNRGETTSREMRGNGPGGLELLPPYANDRYVKYGWPWGGRSEVKGTVKFFEGPLPDDFVRDNQDTAAGWLYSTVTEPPFWSDGNPGTPHNLEMQWDSQSTWGSLQWGSATEYWGQGYGP
jgi:RHS repeat-associated protein